MAVVEVVEAVTSAPWWAWVLVATFLSAGVFKFVKGRTKPDSDGTRKPDPRPGNPPRIEP